ncbi:MAG: DUF2793 domain-containing protein [Marinosulfonomonas sp.]|nr:DUF2793 domain-containing protein [Marinosulfonomonas sp.]
MTNTPRLGLPLLQAAQAQKHITVNEALVLLDGLGQLVLASATTTTPPALASDGDCYAIAVGGVNEWAGHDGEVAIYSNGGWVFAVPLRGWKAWVQDVQSFAMFDGGGWLAGGVALSSNNAATVQEVLEYDHVIGAGTTSSLVAAIPAHSIVLGVTGRVLTAISGTLSSWRLGVATSDNRYGGSLGVSQGAWVRGLTGSPQTYYSATDLLLSGEGGDFAGGEVRMAVHLLRLNLPSA